MLIDNAQELIRSVRPKASRSDQEHRIRIALQQFSRWGLTSVHDAGVGLETISIYKDLLKRGELPVRVYAMASGEAAMTHYLANGPGAGPRQWDADSSEFQAFSRRCSRIAGSGNDGCVHGRAPGAWPGIHEGRRSRTSGSGSAPKRDSRSTRMRSGTALFGVPSMPSRKAV